MTDPTGLPSASDLDAVEAERAIADATVEQPKNSLTENPTCGKYAAPLIARWGYSFSCVLELGHEGPCRPGGTCRAHGPYVGSPGVTPHCPHPIEECVRIIIEREK